MKNLSSFNHPWVVPNRYEFCWTQRKVLWRMWETEQFWGTIDFHSILFSTMEVNDAPKQSVYKLFFIISSFVFSRTKTFIQVWNYLRVIKWWQIFHFWVNYPFKLRVRVGLTSLLWIMSACLLTMYTVIGWFRSIVERDIMLPHSNKDFKTQAKCHELKLQFVSLASLSPSLFENL